MHVFHHDGSKGPVGHNRLGVVDMQNDEKWLTRGNHIQALEECTGSHKIQLRKEGLLFTLSVGQKFNQSAQFCADLKRA